MDFKLLFHLIFGVFSFRKRNMRFFNLKRILIVVFIFPLFLLLLVVNNLFLILDYVFFPFFYFQKIKEPVFIIAAPRSGTTFLYHSLAQQSNQFTYFKLWEIVFAPSVIQKYIFIGLKKADAVIGAPLKKITLAIENKLIGKLKTIHLIGLNLPEEDEGLLLWNLNSIYLNFFYPDSTYFDNYLLFDKKLAPNRKRRIMKSYHNYLKRHNWVFNRKGLKRFLSKNPLMMCKLNSLHAIFPDAVILNINRCPAETLPSTIGLNNALYSLFTSKKSRPELDYKTEDILTQWYLMANDSLNSLYAQQHLKINFYLLTNQDLNEAKKISSFLNLFNSDFLIERKKEETPKHKSKNTYVPLTTIQLEILLEKLPFMKPYCKS